jgi:uncharacterized protein YqgV (UPF0045/DUF77 family)
MANVVVEFLVEPFRDGAPGPHVRAAQQAVRDRQLSLSEGPFGSSFQADAQRSAAVIEALVLAAVQAGATRISLQVTRVDDEA